MQRVFRLLELLMQGLSDERLVRQMGLEFGPVLPYALMRGVLFGKDAMLRALKRSFRTTESLFQPAARADRIAQLREKLGFALFESLGGGDGISGTLAPLSFRGRHGLFRPAVGRVTRASDLDQPGAQLRLLVRKRSRESGGIRAAQLLSLAKRLGGIREPRFQAFHFVPERRLELRLPASGFFERRVTDCDAILGVAKSRIAVRQPLLERVRGLRRRPQLRLVLGLQLHKFPRRRDRIGQAALPGLPDGGHRLAQSLFGFVAKGFDSHDPIVVAGIVLGVSIRKS